MSIDKAKKKFIIYSMVRAVINVNSKQYWVQQGSKIDCDRLEANVGDILKFPIIGFFDNFKDVGTVEIEVLSHNSEEKGYAFYKTRRNHDRHIRGFRKKITKVCIRTIHREGI